MAVLAERSHYAKNDGRLQALFVAVFNKRHVFPLEGALVSLMALLQDFVAVFVYKKALLVRWNEDLEVCL